MDNMGEVFSWAHEKYHEIRRSVSKMTPYKKWKLVRDTTDFLLSMFGIRVLSDGKRNWRTPIAMIASMPFVMLSYYTAWFYWDENKITSIQPQVILAITVPGWILYSRGVGPPRYRYRSIFVFSGQNIYLDREPFTEYERKVDEHATKLIIHSIITTIVVVVSSNMIIIGPIYVFIVHREYVTPLGIVVPFVDHETRQGFAINILTQLTTAGIGAITMVSIEPISCVINNTYTVMADMICFNIRQFSDGLRAGAFSYRNKKELRNIFVQLQDLEAYLDEINFIYYWKFFLQPVLTTGCVALGIFSQLFNGFTAGYGFASCYYFQLLILCYMGNGVKEACEQIQRELYEMNWSLMSPKYQKQVTAALHRWQKGCTLTIGPFEELNYETATNLTLLLFMTYMVE